MFRYMFCFLEFPREIARVKRGRPRRDGRDGRQGERVSAGWWKERDGEAWRERGTGGGAESRHEPSLSLLALPMRRL